MRRAAEDAIVRVGGMLPFVRSSEDHVAVEPRALYVGVEPILRR
jgi:hypothetical protein